MRKSATNRSVISAVLLLALAAALLVSGLAGAAGTKTVVKEGAATDNNYLTNVKGRTLYTLSNERGRFVCKGYCLQTWFPLIVPAGVKPVGPVKLGVRKRPDGRMQVTRNGLPLYTFAGDAKRGDTNGEGLKTGGGTWHVSRINHRAPPSPPPNPYGY
jgi:predicted lipoprotein with Yx(FWY)xxD motif